MTLKQQEERNISSKGNWNFNENMWESRNRILEEMKLMLADFIYSSHQTSASSKCAGVMGVCQKHLQV
jgi:hypothetical protein